MDTARWLDHLYRETLDHPVVSHPMLQAFDAGNVSWQQARAFGLLYYPHIQRTQRYQAAALSVMLDEGLQGALAEILYDGYGSGNPQRAHTEVYRQLMRALGWGPEDWESASTDYGLNAYNATHRSLCTGHWCEAIGVAGLALSWSVPAIYTKIISGLQPHGLLNDYALEFLRGHVERDVAHGRNVRDALVPLLDSSVLRRRVRSGLMTSLDAQHRMMDGLWNALTQLDTVAARKIA